MLDKLSDAERRHVIFRPINAVEGVFCIDTPHREDWPLFVKITGEHPIQTINEVLTVMPPYLEAHVNDYNGDVTNEIKKVLILTRIDDEEYYDSTRTAEPISKEI